MLGQVLGSYTIERELGRGGMGAVYTAVHTLLGRRAAVKVLLPELSQNQDLVQRFFNEARAATAIKHPSIVEIYDFGWAPDGSAYIVMEYLEGEALGARLQRLGRLPVAMAVTIARQIANALAAAHRAGIVHRDLKPDNVYLVADVEVVGGERVKLLDFGIAKLAVAGAVSRTTTGAIMGTPLYMSPEQCEGARHVDHRTDLYALGCILFEMIAGHPPFQSEGVGALIGAHLHLAPPTLRSVVPEAPAEVEAIVARLLMKAPGDRYATADELVAALTRVGTRPSANAAAFAAPAGLGHQAASGTAPSGPGPTPTTLSGSSGALARAPAGSLAPSPSGSPSRRGRWLAVGGLAAAAGVAIAVVAVSSGKRGAGAGTAPGLDAATVAVGAVDAAGVAPAVDAAGAVGRGPDAAAPSPADAALAAMRAAVPARDWVALHAALDRVYDTTTDGDPRRAQADLVIEQARPLIIAVATAEIEGDIQRSRCADAKRRATETLEAWGDAALPLKKLAARCKTRIEVPIDAGVAPPGPGELTSERIRMVMQRAMGRLRTCAGPFEARLRVHLTVLPDGRVDRVAVDGEPPEARACVSRVLPALRFPPSTIGAQVTWPLVLLPLRPPPIDPPHPPPPIDPPHPPPTTGPLEPPRPPPTTGPVPDPEY